MRKIQEETLLFNVESILALWRAPKHGKYHIHSTIALGSFTGRPDDYLCGTKSIGLATEEVFPGNFFVFRRHRQIPLSGYSSFTVLNEMTTLAKVP